MHPKKNRYADKNTYTSMGAKMFVTTENWLSLKCPMIENQLGKLWYSHLKEKYENIEDDVKKPLILGNTQYIAKRKKTGRKTV